MIGAVAQPTTTLDAAVAAVAAGAARRDRAPAFPADALAALVAAGATVPPATIGAGVGPRPARGRGRRIRDGHLNALERVGVAAPAALRIELERAVGEDGLLLGVWGADPAPGEGEPARLHGHGPQRRLHGVKTFCSGAGGLDGALVVAGADEGRLLVHVDTRGPGLEVDRTWFRSMGDALLGEPPRPLRGRRRDRPRRGGGAAARALVRPRRAAHDAHLGGAGGRRGRRGPRGACAAGARR
jgi:hypothetical protein